MICDARDLNMSMRFTPCKHIYSTRIVPLWYFFSSNKGRYGFQYVPIHSAALTLSLWNRRTLLSCQPNCRKNNHTICEHLKYIRSNITIRTEAYVDLYL